MKRNTILACLCMLVLLLGSAHAQAAVRAVVDRTEIALGESVALTIETDQLTAIPDLSPLAADFRLSGQSSSRQMQMGAAGVSASTTHAVNLTPRRAGVLSIPSLQVGSERTAPLSVTVAELPSVATAGANARAFLETEVDDAAPYVQQSVGVTVRLFYAVPLASGQLDLDTPEGASLQRVGEDVQSSRDVDGRRYNVVERRFLLVPERSGALVIPGARFVGRGAGGWMDDFFGGNSREMRANGAPRRLEVRPQPANAPQPWLPLRDLALRYVAAPQELRAGAAATLVVEATARGAIQAQMPELPTPSVPGAQVFAEPAQYDETFSGGSPQVRLTRRYSIVPNAQGRLVVPGIKLAWWDVTAAAPRTASLPDLELAVAPGSASFAAPAAADAIVTDPDRSSALAVAAQDAAGHSRTWQWIALGFAGLWLLTLLWALLARRARASAPLDPAATSRPQAAGVALRTRADLKRALDSGSLDDVGEVLRLMAAPPATDLDALMARLDDRSQRDAVEQLRRARWADGDGVAARAALRQAFAAPPAWKAPPPVSHESLPPLYPPR
jgi:hypothetical protein